MISHHFGLATGLTKSEFHFHSFRECSTTTIGHRADYFIAIRTSAILVIRVGQKTYQSPVSENFSSTAKFLLPLVICLAVKTLKGSVYPYILPRLNCRLKMAGLPNEIGENLLDAIVNLNTSSSGDTGVSNNSLLNHLLDLDTDSGTQFNSPFDTLPLGNC